MRILVTGLCMQGNKGGPALALSLKKQIRKYIPKASFVFSVPPGEEYQYEVKWASEYKVEVVADFGYKDIVPPFAFKSIGSKKKRVTAWIRALRESDVVVDLSGISYVGPPVGSNRAVLLGSRFRHFLFSKLLGKKFLAWTQSYGPLSSTVVRALARIDLGMQPIVFCRGEDCAAEVKRLLPYKRVLSFPDVATILHYDRNWGKKYLEGNFNMSHNNKKLVTVSPSAVIYSRQVTSSGENQYINDMMSVCTYLVGRDYFVLIVPHTYRVGCNDPRRNDYAVGRIIVERMGITRSVAMVEEDFSPMQLKSIISNAYLHIGGRYHSIVGALSCGVPSLSVSWHPKYRDIMRMYGSEKFVVDAGHKDCTEKMIFLFEELEEKREEYSCRLIEIERVINKRVEENTQLFLGML